MPQNSFDDMGGGGGGGGGVTINHIEKLYREC